MPQPKSSRMLHTRGPATMNERPANQMSLGQRQVLDDHINRRLVSFTSWRSYVYVTSFVLLSTFSVTTNKRFIIVTC